MSLGLRRAIRGALGVSGIHYAGGSPYSLAFHALYPSGGEMTDVLSGTGGMTTVHADPLYAPDHEGVYREFAANEPVYSGVRYVKNITTYSEDISNVVWTKLAATANDATEIEFTGVGGACYQQLSIDGGTASKSIIVSVTMWTNSGTELARIRNTHAGVVDNQTSDLTITTTPTRFVFAVTNNTSSGNGAQYCGVINGTDNATRTLNISNLQVEVANGRSDTTTPSEYIPTTTAAVTKHFTTANGNSVASNVVTEGTGAALTDWWLQYYPAAENSLLYSRDMTNAYWGTAGTPVITYDQTGLTGAPNTASLIGGNGVTGSGVASKNSTVANDNVIYTTAQWVKKNGTAVNAWIDQRLVGGTTEIYWIGGIDLATGSASGTPNISGSATIEVVDDGDWWKIMVQLTNNTTGNTSLRVGSMTVNSTDGGNVNGTLTLGNNEVHYGKTIAEVRGLAPIFTTSAAVSTDRTEYSFDMANHTQDSGAFYAEIVTSVNLTSGSHTFYGRAGGNTFLGHIGNAPNGILRSTDATNFAEQVALNARDTSQKIASVWHTTDATLGANANNTWSGEGAYDGAFDVSSQWYIAHSSSFATKIRNLRRYNINNYAAGKSVIDGLMA